MSSDASLGLSFKDKEEANIQSRRDEFSQILLTDVWRLSTTGKHKSYTPASAPPPATRMIFHCSGTYGGASSSSGGGGDGARKGDSWDGNRNDSPTLPYADGNEGKVEQCCFNGGRNTAPNV